MKTKLTFEQSQHLIDLGVPEEMASDIEEYNDPISQWTHRGASIFQLTDLLVILPKEINNRNDINMEWHSLMECYVVGYGSIETSRRFAKELIDALYQLACWYYEEFKEK